MSSSPCEHLHGLSHAVPRLPEELHRSNFSKAWASALLRCPKLRYTRPSGISTTSSGVKHHCWKWPWAMPCSLTTAWSFWSRSQQIPSTTRAGGLDHRFSGLGRASRTKSTSISRIRNARKIVDLFSESNSSAMFILVNYIFFKVPLTHPIQLKPSKPRVCTLRQSLWSYKAHACLKSLHLHHDPVEKWITSPSPRIKMTLRTACPMLLQVGFKGQTCNHEPLWVPHGLNVWSSDWESGTWSGAENTA